MRSRDDQQVRPVQHLRERGEPLIGDVRIGAQHLAGLENQDFAELIGQTFPRVITAGLESHSQHSDGQRAEVVAGLQPGDEVEREALIDQHCRVPEHKLVLVERGELHRVLEQARAGREPRPGHIGGPRIVVAYCPAYPLKVEAVVIRHHPELISGGEFDVPPGVGE